MSKSKQADAAELIASAFDMNRKRVEEIGSLFGKLTCREYQAAVLISRGLPAKTVAAEMEISVRTTESFRRSVMKKLGTRTNGIGRILSAYRVAVAFGIAEGRTEKKRKSE